MQRALTPAASLLAATLTLTPLAAQEIEIFIPTDDDDQAFAVAPSQPRSKNRLANCMASGAEADCAGINLSGETQLESTSVSDVALETFVLDLSDGGDDATVDTAAKTGYDASREPDEYDTKRPVTSVGIEIAFDFGSAAIRYDQADKIASLAAALSDPVNADAEFLVVGHTDAVGSAAFNCGLSRSRAGSVADALVRQGSYAKLISVGAGEYLLKTPSYPDDGANRRVTFIRVDPDYRQVIGAFQRHCARY